MLCHSGRGLVIVLVGKFWASGSSGQSIERRKRRDSRRSAGNAGTAKRAPERRDRLHSRSLFELETGSANLAAFNADLVSLPDDVSGSPPIESLLDAEVSRYLEAYHELMLRPKTEMDDIEYETRGITPYSDRKLLFNTKRITPC